MNNLLITLAIDFEAPNGFAGRAPAILRSLEHGKGGQVRSAKLAGSLIAAREERGGETAPHWSPAQGPDGWLTVMAGRLQERELARQRLGLPPEANDGDIYAQAFAQSGERCDTALIGDYAVIQWHPDKREVRLARSAMSMQPLHVWREGARLVIASLPMTLIAAGLEPRIDQQKLEDSLLLNFNDPQRSWYQRAHRVAAGTYERHDPTGSRASRFFSVGQVPEVRFARDEDYVEALDDQFRRATRAEMEGVGRPAILLSGGFDSQCVASYLAQLGGSDARIESFTSVPQEGWEEPDKPLSFGDETPYVRALAEQYPQIQPHFVTGESRVFGQDLEAMMQLGGWPMRNESNLHWVHEAHEQAAGLGCDAMFYGANGNATFSYDGETGYASWLRDGNLGRLAIELARRKGDDRSFLRKFLVLALLPNLPNSMQDALRSIASKQSDPFAAWCPMRESHARQSGALDRAMTGGADPRFPDLPRSIDWRQWAMGDLLSEGAEIDLAFRLHHGIPARDPTLFQPLVEFCTGIADDQYLRDGENRWLARRLLQGRVPDMVHRETRIGRQSPDWALRFERDRPQLLKELQSLEDDSQLADILDLERLSQDLSQWDGTEDSKGIWKQKIHSGVARALSTARFVRYVERRNVGI